MRFDKIIRSVAPVIAMAAAAGVAGCNSAKVSINGEEGVPLAELDMTGAPPEEVVLLGPDSVIIHEGSSFAIDVEGSDEARERVRFVLKDNSLGIMRQEERWTGDDLATIRVTMPAPSGITIAGSGEASVDAMADDAEVTIAGSGQIKAPDLTLSALELTIAGSGRVEMGGTAKELELNVAGSGYADLAEMQVGEAELSIAGSGNAVFASDGEVEASIMGSGNVTVRGDATCTVSSMGAGKLRCERGAKAEG